MIKLLSVVGARPQFIKAGAVRRALERWNRTAPETRRVEEILVHTGQHYDDNMSAVFFEELELPRPAYNLGVGSDTHGRQTGRMLAALEDVLLQAKPDLVLVYGDTNSTLAGVLAAVKLHIPTAHVEAGLRSFNRSMPEEINRVVADELSQILFCPTAAAVENLRREGILDEPAAVTVGDVFRVRRVVQVGDVMADSILYHEKIADKKSAILRKLGLTGSDQSKRYVLLTLHRAENVDDPHRLKQIVDTMRKIGDSGFRVVFPIHPRTRKRMESFGLPIPGLEGGSALSNIQVVDPVGYLDMLALEKHAFAVVTDSGGVQKEAFLLRVPCVTVRGETEWVETVALGWNRVTGAEPEKILEAVHSLLDWRGQRAPFGDHQSGEQIDPNPYGTGHAADRIIAFLANLFPPRFRS